MEQPSQRFTIVVRSGSAPAMSWRGRRILFVGSLALIDAALARHDVERIILDRSVTAEEFLNLLATIPAAVTADILFVGPQGGGFLSAIGRGGDRVLYAPSPRDVDFYLQIHGLSTYVQSLALTA